MTAPYDSMNARDYINVLKQHYNLKLTYEDWVTGPGHAQLWTGLWKLEDVGEIGRASATSRIAAKEESARVAVSWLSNSGH
ncbi:hypothetical protein CPB86DRAFT_778702 [Serendipita vermifera]|nr:hypothetical protein CPB86DRAFT_778702 [Serendipita vermifera]